MYIRVKKDDTCLNPSKISGTNPRFRGSNSQAAMMAGHVKLERTIVVSRFGKMAVNMEEHLLDGHMHSGSTQMASLNYLICETLHTLIVAIHMEHQSQKDNLKE